jgi:hypothetical protein
MNSSLLTLAAIALFWNNPDASSLVYWFRKSRDTQDSNIYVSVMDLFLLNADVLLYLTSGRSPGNVVTYGIVGMCWLLVPGFMLFNYLKTGKSECLTCFVF